ncbi:MAG TPA: hypothetical protein VET65_10925 [Candidatus Limnocylindrales bacterium]|nr:hypothetical protein [Candidatus Limnocylindrales bacterium]
MSVTASDFQLHGRIENYRERLTEILTELDRIVREVMEQVNRDRLEGTGRITYETLPPRWTLAWRAMGGRYEANLMAFAQGGAWVIHGRTGLDRPFRNFAGARERDVRAIRAEVIGQLETDVAFR